jgi:hypothetical protein
MDTDKEQQIEEILSTDEGMRSIAKACAEPYAKYGEEIRMAHEETVYALLKMSYSLDGLIKKTE